MDNNAVMVIFIVGSVLLLGGGGFLYWRWLEKRKAEFRSFAQQRGLQYTEQDNSWAQRFQGEPFGKGRSRRATNIVVGQFGPHRVAAYDYQYTISSGSGQNRRSETYRFSIYTQALPATLPGLQVSNEGFLSSIGRRMGIKDIELESEDFNRKFKVESDNRKFAYDVLHPRMMEWLLHVDGPPWRIEGSTLITWSKGRLQIPTIEQRWAFLGAVVEGIPNFVWDGGRRHGIG